MIGRQPQYTCRANIQKKAMVASFRWSIPLVLVHLAMVGVASHSGETTAVASTSPGIGVLLLRILESVGILVALAATVLVAAAWPGIRRRRKPDDLETRKVHWAVRLALLLLYLALLGGIVAALRTYTSGPREPEALPATAALPPLAAPTSVASGQTWPSFPVVFAVVFLLAAAASVAWWWSHRRPNLTSQSPGDGLSIAIDDGLSALERESDPRRAVILAYHAMERALARQGFGRNAAEAPLEYMLRVLAHVPDCHDPVHSLTRLFEEAKYSRHEIGPPDRESAIQALQSVRASLQAAV
jgi:hypothetical protein